MNDTHLVSTRSIHQLTCFIIITLCCTYTVHDSPHKLTLYVMTTPPALHFFLVFLIFFSFFHSRHASLLGYFCFCDSTFPYSSSPSCARQSFKLCFSLSHTHTRTEIPPLVIYPNQRVVGGVVRKAPQALRARRSKNKRRKKHTLHFIRALLSDSTSRLAGVTDAVWAEVGGVCVRVRVRER